MSPHDDFDRSVARWFEFDARPVATADVLDRALRATRSRRPYPRLYATLRGHWVGTGASPSEVMLLRTAVRWSTALIVLLLVVAVVAGAVAVGARLLQPAPVTPPPISSEPGELVFNLRSWSADPDPIFVEVAAYADGRVMWVADERVGFVAQRLTAGGVERLRSRVLSAGLFDGNLALGMDGAGWGSVTVNRGDRSVIVAWGGSSVNVSGLGLEDSFVRATSEQAAEVSELDAFLRDPVGWGFPDDAYVQHEVTPYVPSHLWLSYDRSVPILSNLPSAAREILTRVLRSPVRDECELISIAEAQEVAQALAGAGILEPDYEVRGGFAFVEPGSGSFVHLNPALPHGVAVCGTG